MDQSERLTELEIKYAHQELALEKLQQTVIEQDSALQRLETVIKVLRERVEALAQGEGDIVNTKPPHY